MLREGNKSQTTTKKKSHLNIELISTAFPLYDNNGCQKYSCILAPDMVLFHSQACSLHFVFRAEQIL